MQDKEQSFLSHVAKVLGRDKPLTVAPKRDEVGPPTFWKEQKFDINQPLDFFKSNLENLTGRVYVAQDSSDANQKLKAWLVELGAQKVILWDHEELRSIVNLEDTGLTVDYWSPDRPQDELVRAAEQADVGITWVDYAIGYTGTLALFSGPTQGRSVSLLPTVHIAMFRKDNLVPTMSTVMKNLMERRSINAVPAAIDFITGPSRTSDIEMDLSIGVHGPVKVWAIVIEGSGQVRRNNEMRLSPAMEDAGMLNTEE
jgi:L-lactate dehydrogenase complex protein LldG